MLKIERKFSNNLITDAFDRRIGKEVYDYFKWKKVDVQIKDFSTGEIIFEGKDLEFPEHFSQQACEIIASKYFFRNIDGKGTPETSYKQVVHRMATFWTDALIDEGLIEGENIASCKRSAYGNWYSVGSDAETFYDEIVYTLIKQMWSPNSPQYFNTGIELAYGIKGESDDMYYYDQTGIHKSPDRYTRSQTSACFIIPVTDHLLGKNSITDHFVTETKLFKGGSGVGTNFSPLRAEGEQLSSGGVSSGVMSFLLGLDRNAGAIKSGGTTRRAAKMVILDVDHPDIEEFIDWKAHEEKKARDLVSLGYDGSLNGEAYQTVSGQNSNNSVRVSDAFMNKILELDPDPMFELTGRKDKSKNRTVNVFDIWDKIAQAAWECGDPAIQFDDVYNEWHTAPKAGRINATNPCSEYAFIDNSACNLASINLEKFFIETEYGGGFDFKSYKNLIDLIQLVLEASIHWGQFPTPEVAENTYKYRATGLGFCNLASLLLKFRKPYDSEWSKKMAETLAGVLTAESFIQSSKMAKEIGTCEGYEENKDEMMNVLENWCEITPPNSKEEYLFDKALEQVGFYGVRNMQVTCLAPTGTISLAMDCGATGIEPFFSHKFYKKCSDGSVMEMVNPLAKEYLEFIKNSSGICQKDYDEILNYFDEHLTFKGAPYLADFQQDILQTANDISPTGHVEMMGALQKFITGSISKTVNLPNDATVEDIKNVYEYAYQCGCKSISIYRDGSKNAQPLNVEKDDEEKESCVHIDKYDDYQECLEKPEFETQTIELDVADNQNIEIHSSQEHIYLSSDKPIKVKNEVYAEFKDCDDLNYVTATVIDDTTPIQNGQIIEASRLDDTVGFKSNMQIEPELTDRMVHVAVPEEIVSKKLERKKPDGIRLGVTHTAKIGNIELYVTVSYYDDESLCEIFVSSDKEGTTIKGLLSSLSKAISHMLQYGIPPKDIATMLRNQQYEPQGVVERHPYIKMCTSISDFIARVIEYETWDFSRCQIKPTEHELYKHVHLKDENEMTLMVVDDDGTCYINEECIDLDFENKDEMRDEVKEVVDKLNENRKELYQDLADMDDEFKIQDPIDSTHDVIYTGSECPVCHGTRMVQNGTCELCLDCGNTSGCS